MNNPYTLTRRNALLMLAAFGIWPLGCDQSMSDAVASPSASDRFRTLRSDREAAALIGRAWLRAQPSPPTEEELLRRLPSHRSLQPDELREALQRAHRDDLRAERYESVSGWQLSRTEVHLYALLARVE